MATIQRRQPVMLHIAFDDTLCKALDGSRLIVLRLLSRVAFTNHTADNVSGLL